jgi:alpha-glucosidase
MPWSSTAPHAGFSATEPWLPMVDDAPSWSVDTQRDDPESMLHLHRRLLALRRASEALHRGAWTPVAPADGWPEGLVAFERTHGAERVLVLLNLTPDPLDVALRGAWTVAVGTNVVRDGTTLRDGVTLAGDEGLVLVPA